MKSGVTSKRQLWSDIKSGSLRTIDEYDCCSTPSNWETTLDLLQYLNAESKKGVASVSAVVQEWCDGRDVHSIMHAMARREIHTDHWLEIISEYKKRENKSTVKQYEFLKQPKYKALWRAEELQTRSRSKSCSKEELLGIKSDYECFLKVWEEDSKEARERCSELRVQLEAEREHASGDAFEKALTLKDLNGNPDELGWHLLEQMRKNREQLEKHLNISTQGCT